MIRFGKIHSFSETNFRRIVVEGKTMIYFFYDGFYLIIKQNNTWVGLTQGQVIKKKQHLAAAATNWLITVLQKNMKFFFKEEKVLRENRFLEAKTLFLIDGTRGAN